MYNDDAEDAKEDVVVNAYSRNTSVLNNARHINVSIPNRTWPSGTYTLIGFDTYCDKPVWSNKLDNNYTAYVYYDKEDYLTIGIFSTILKSNLISFLDGLNCKPYEGASGHWRLTKTGWNTITEVNNDFVWNSTEENIEITIS